MSDLIRLYRVVRNCEGKHCGNEYIGDLVTCEKCNKSKLYTMNSNLPISRWCHRFSVPVAVEDDDYCSYAERRNDEQDSEM